ncbi:Hypothetical predicted protein [Paramuricea clavata]|uniref:Uncharacterized protein n=1 Tax=Paramuricea clavata TaxID=317549 RepID=A0A7D9HMZ0_PARCT|nr:Hypothetical predicted protein [Paramuricea clavata]
MLIPRMIPRTMADIHDIAMNAQHTFDVMRILYLKGHMTAINRSMAIHVMALPVEKIHTTNKDAWIYIYSVASRNMSKCVRQGRYVVKAMKSDMAKFRIILSEAVRRDRLR